MTDLRKAAEMALEALEWINRVNAMDYEYQRKAQEPIQALRQALAQPEWVGLTDEELLTAYGWIPAPGAPDWVLNGAKEELLDALRNVEAKLKEKNT